MTEPADAATSAANISRAQALIDEGRAWSDRETREWALALITHDLCRPPQSVRSLLEASAAEREAQPLRAESERWQGLIDSGAAWTAPRHVGFLAMLLVKGGVCRLAPGVLSVRARADDAWELAYTQEDVSRWVDEATERLPRLAQRIAVVECFKRIVEEEHAEVVQAMAQASLSLWATLRKALGGRDAAAAVMRAAHARAWARACQEVGVDPESVRDLAP